MPHELYQVVIGRRELPERNCMLRGGSDALVHFTYSLWIVVHGSAVTLIDTGFDAETAARRGIHFERTALDAIHEFDIAANDVTTVVLSHLHFDHAGGLDAFPQATVYLQQADLDFYTGPFMRFPLCASAIEATHLAAIERVRSDGRLVLLSGDSNIEEHIRVHHLGGHTPGTQAVEVRSGKTTTVLASDAAHLYANLDHQVPFPVLHDVPTSCLAFERLERLSAEGAAVVPGHDGAVMDRFERVAGQRAQYAVRLA